MAEKKNSDLTRIMELIEIMKENDLVEIEIKHDDDKIFLKRYQAPPAGASVPAAAQNIVPATAGPNAAQAPAAGTEPAASQPEENLVEIKSPLVGTFYSAPSPDSEPYVEVGSEIEAQMVICIIEAMKVMNEIKAETSGTVAEILVETGQAVEYGQVLFKVKPD